STFTFMMAMGFTMNMMTMLALTISVGMIVDDSIVVLENSYRHLEAGMTRMKAALAGIAEIGFAVIATSLAIVAVFVPVAFMEGIVGQFFFEFGLTVSFAVIVSTFIAVTLSPMLCSRVLTVSKQHGRFFNISERIFQRIETGYGKTLRWALGHRAVVLLTAAGIFVGSMALTGLLGTEFVPEADEDQFNVQVETPIGTALEASSADLEKVEALVRELPGVEDVFTTIGAGVEERVNVATVLVRLAPKAERDFSQMDLMQQLRQQVKTHAELDHMKISVEVIPRVGGGGFRNAPVQYNVRGTDIAKLAEFSDRVALRMKEVPGIEDVNSTYDAGKPQINVEIDRDKAADLHVSVDKLGKAIYALIGGQEVSQFEEDGESYDVRIRLAGADRDKTKSILRVPVRNKLGQIKEAREMVDVYETKGPVQIDRQDRSRQVTVMANLDTAIKPLGEALDDVRAIEKDLGLPPGTTSKVTGAGEMMAESFANIIFSMVLAAVLIYMVLAAQFESLVHPLTVMLSLPLSVVGALGLLAVTGRTLNIFSMIGMIMLMGLVTKNAILLVDYTNLLRSRGMSKTDALLEAGPVRLRPILMTAMSTMAGMTPVAIGMGSGAETRAPMGTAIVGGMITSTILTLVVIPVVYSTVDDLAAWVRRMIFGAEVVPETGISEPTPAGADPSGNGPSDLADAGV
ncbi:MAG: efflux RND transporter permease subunit, partial [Planctomycetes bacterium]|nr:efflux RND transporter permease subunit [Planctomycetota bacterium]